MSQYKFRLSILRFYPLGRKINFLVGVRGAFIFFLLLILLTIVSISSQFYSYAAEPPERGFNGAPPAPSDCKPGGCLYNWGTGEWMLKPPAGSTSGLQPCQSATVCGGNSNSASNPNCATAAGCSYQNASGNQIRCANGFCTECSASGSCFAIGGNWNQYNQGQYCVGPGCSPGSVAPTQCTSSNACIGNFPGSSPNSLGYGQIFIGGTLVIFNPGSPVSTDGKYQRSCTGVGSCTVNRTVTSTTGSGSTGVSNQSPQFYNTVTSTSGIANQVVALGTNICGGAANCNFTFIHNNVQYQASCGGATGGGEACAVVPVVVGQPALILHSNLLLGSNQTPFFVNQSNLDNPSVNRCLASSCYVQTEEHLYLCQSGGCNMVSDSTSAPSAAGPTANSSACDGVSGCTCSASGCSVQVANTDGTVSGLACGGPMSCQSVANALNRLQSGGANVIAGTSCSVGVCFGTANGLGAVCNAAGGCALIRRVSVSGGSVEPGGQPGVPSDGTTVDSPIDYPSYGAAMQVFSQGKINSTNLCGDKICGNKENPVTCSRDCGGNSQISCTVDKSRRLFCKEQ